MITHDRIDWIPDNSDYEDEFDYWIADQGIYTPLLKKSDLMEEAGITSTIKETDDLQKKATEIWKAYCSGTKKFIMQLGKENIKVGDLCENTRDKLIDILECSILPYAFGDKGIHNTKNKQIKKIREWMEKGLDIIFISPRFNRVIRGVRDIFSDILYWGWHLNAQGVKDIKLANSDLHNRGLGVAFVTYITEKGGIFKNVKTVRKVIKPEDKSLEQSLLGVTGSLAQEFNARQINVGGKRMIGNVTRLDIRSSRKHGSMVEFFEGEQINELKNKKDSEPNTESDSKVLTQIFASLTGMDDLHYENLTYKKDEKTGKYSTLAMIDADNALSKRIFGNVKFAREKNSGFGEEKVDIGPITGIDKDFIINHVKPKFAGKKGRTVPVRTGDLVKLKNIFWEYTNNEFIKGETWDIYINFFLNGIKEDKRISSKTDEKLKDSAEGYIIIRFLKLLESGSNDLMSAPGLQGVVGPADGRMNNEQKRIAVYNALRDFQNGQIPFYEYDYSTGFVLSHGQVIWQGPNLDEIFSEEAVRQMLANLNNPNG